jgi:uncharacterized surface protein with fasciclin (FAS1) repeats
MTTISRTIVATGNLKNLVRASQKAGIIESLSGKGPFTVFAPSNEAFAKFTPETIELTLKDKEQLNTIVKAHIASGMMTSSNIGKIKKMGSINGKELIISTTKGLCIQDAKIIKPGITCDNGIIHIVDDAMFLKK